MKEKVKDMVFPTKYSESVQKGTFQTFMRPSMTEPDNAMSIPEIIARFTRGYGVQVPVHPWQSGSAFEGEDPEKFLQEEFGPKPAPQAPAEPASQAPAEPAPQAPAEPASHAPAEPAPQAPKSEGQ